MAGDRASRERGGHPRRGRQPHSRIRGLSRQELLDSGGTGRRPGAGEPPKAGLLPLHPDRRQPHGGSPAGWPGSESAGSVARCGRARAWTRWPQSGTGRAPADVSTGHRPDAGAVPWLGGRRFRAGPRDLHEELTLVTKATSQPKRRTGSSSTKFGSSW